MNYYYRAYLKNGRVVTGEVEATGKQDAMRQLAGQGRAVFSLTEAAAGPKKTAAKPKSTRGFSLTNRKFSAAQLFADLALLTDAGLTITQALRSMHSTEVALEQRRVTGELLDDMSAGINAASAFAAIRSIPIDSLGLIASGESAGRLPEVFKALAEQYDERARLKSQMINALGYPVFLLALMILAILVLTFALVPGIEPIFQSADKPPPLIVAALSTLRQALTDKFHFLFLIVLAVTLLFIVLPKQRALAARYFYRSITQLPLIGLVVSKTALSRYLSSLSLLLSNGTTMSRALELAANSVSISTFQTRLMVVRDRVATGERLPAALSHCGLFDDRVISLIAVGDEANRLAIVTKRAANILESEAQLMIKRCFAILTPAMTIAIGLLIGGLVVSVMTALLGINEFAVQ